MARMTLACAIQLVRFKAHGAAHPSQPSWFQGHRRRDPGALWGFSLSGSVGWLGTGASTNLKRADKPLAGCSFGPGLGCPPRSRGEHAGARSTPAAATGPRLAL
jgi:hypothetical protein